MMFPFWFPFFPTYKKDTTKIMIIVKKSGKKEKPVYLISGDQLDINTHTEFVGNKRKSGFMMHKISISVKDKNKILVEL